MKITPDLLKDVQRDIDDHGLEVAIHNLLWRQASEQMMDLGVTRVRTTRPPATKAS